MMNNFILKMSSIFITGSIRSISSFSNLQKKLITIYSLVIAFINIYFVIFSFPDAILLRAFHVTSFAALGIVLYSPNKNSDKKLSFFDFIILILILATMFYFISHIERIILRWSFYDLLLPLDLFFGIVLILIAFEVGRRVLGWPMLTLSILFMLYALLGHYVSGIFSSVQIGFGRIIETQFLTTYGLFGFVTGVSATYVFMFILFGSILQCSGGKNFFINLGTILGGTTRGGAAKTAVFASALFAMMSGSPNANVATTGAVTIPMMKSLNYPPEFAASVEAAASTGGTITPPVMGAVAFLLAEFVGVSYSTVIGIAAIPALIYYISMFFAIDREALRRNLKSSSSETVNLFTVLLDGLPFVIPIIYLVYRIIAGIPAPNSAFEATVLIVILSILKAIFTKNKDNISVGGYITGIVVAMKTITVVAVACILAGTIIGNLYLTGGGIKFSILLMSLAKGFLPLVILLSMVLTVILGMGIPVSACYILAVSLAGPALIMAGIPKLNAHFFIAWFAALATITPPVCMSSYLAASIAGVNDSFKVAKQTVLLALSGFILPIIFIYRPELLAMEGIFKALLTTFFVILGTYAMNIVIFGNFIYYKCKLYETIIIIISSFMLYYPSYIINVIGLLCFGIVVLLQYIKRKKEGINFRYNVDNNVDNMLI